MSERVLVIAAHPDDEVLGCGGTIARHARQGDRVDILLLADGVTSRRVSTGAEQREMAAVRAAEVLGASRPITRGFPDNRLDSVPLLDLVQEIEAVMNDIRPTIMYTHHAGDLNIDHQVTSRAALTACRPLPGRELRKIFLFEVLSSTEWGCCGQNDVFWPQFFVDITETLPEKIRALHCYDEEMRPFPHARSYETVTALARLRGGQSGLNAAEAFTVHRQIWR